MLGNSRRISALFLLLFVAANLHAQTLSKEKQSQISQSVSDFMAATSVPGVSVAVVLNGQPAWSAGFGMADLENFVPATSATLFRLASVSKPITATAILQLSERGKLDLDAPIQKYCPAFPKKEVPITTRQLLGHLAGIRHDRTHSFDDPEIINTKHVDDPISGGLEYFKDDPLVAAPGTKFSYSSNGYTVVGCVIE